MKRFFRLQDYSIRKYNFKVIVAVVFLCVIGYLVLSSAVINDVDRDSTLNKQLVGFFVGTVLLIIFSLFDYHQILRAAPFVYIGVAIMLVLTLIIGVEVADASRWLKIGGFQFQPSEFAKIGIIIIFASFFNSNQDRISEPRIVGIALALFALLAGLVLLEPDLSTTIVIVMIFLSLFVVAGIDKKWIFGTIGVLVPLFGLFLFLVTRENQTILHEYQLNRILSWLHPEEYAATGLTTQQDNSILAISSGQWFGKGLFNSSLQSVKNGNFLSEENCDFIFAVVGEELGFVGSVLILGLMTFLVVQLFKIGTRSKDMGGKLIATGMGTLLAFQTFVNVAVATSLLPNTGLPFPFFSAGASSIISIFIGIGITLNVGLQRKNLDFV